MTKYIPERDYVKHGWKPVKKGPDDLCGSCEAYYKNLYDQKITKTPFPPSCSKHVLEPINKLKASDFESEEEFEFARISLDPVAWAAYELEWDLRWYQADVLSCLPASEMVFMADGTVKSIADIKLGDTVITYDQKGNRIFTKPVSKIYANGVKDVYSIKLENGDEIKCTSDHKILAHVRTGKTNTMFDCGSLKREYASINTGLKVGDRVFTLNRFDKFGAIDNDNLAKFLGYIGSDGYINKIGKNRNIYVLEFSNIRKDIIDDYLRVFKASFPNDKITIKFIPAHEYSGSWKQDTWKCTTYGKNSESLKFLYSIGAIGKETRESAIAKFAFNLSEKSLACFLNSLYAGDGCVYIRSGIKDGAVISLLSGDKDVLNIYRLLLKKVGIQSIHIYDKTDYSTKGETGITLTFSMRNDVERFLNFVGPITGKENKCFEALEILKTITGQNRRRFGTTTRAKIVSIEYVGKQEVYDIEVPHWHNFFANGIIVHNCTSQFKVLRQGRRSGKSNTLMVDALHFVSTNPGKTVLILAPYEPQVEKLFEELHMLINRSKTIKQSIVRDVKKPCMISFANGSHIKGLSAGSKNTTNRSDKIRGQDAHYIIIDEIDYIPDEDLVAITAILASHNDCKIAVCCTPTGEHARFFSYCVDKDQKFKEFHIIAQESPEWSTTVEEFFLRDYGGKNTPAWDHEILAEFGKQEHGVFSNEKINSCLQDYSISAAAPKAGASYICGVDWNKNAGTHILIIETNGTLFKPVLKIIIPNSDFTQIEAVDKIIELYYHWNLSLIVVDVGYGSTQIELLKKHGLQNPQGGLHRRLKPIAMQEHIEIRDPQNGLVRRTPTKPFLVNCLKNELDEGKLILPKDEDTIETRKNATHGLVQQMRNFKIEGQSIYGVPKYSQGEDHTLTAFMLGVSGYVLEHSDLQKINFSTRVGIVSTSPENKATSAEQLAEKENLKKDPSAVPSRQLNKGSSLFGYSSKNGSSVIKQQKHIRTFGHGLAQNKPNSSFKRKSF